MEKTVRHGLSGNALKIIAMLAMLIDHVGYYLFPTLLVLRAVGRIAFPIFAYMIAEGYAHTRSRLRYFLTVAGVGVLSQLAATIGAGVLHMNILITFALAIAVAALSDTLLQGTPRHQALAGVALAGILFLVAGMPYLSSLSFDYGAVGVLLPPMLYRLRGQGEKLLAVALAIAALSIGAHPVRWCALFAIPLLALYNGQRGKAKLKYLFYLFYPAHIAILWLLAELLRLQ